MTARERSTLLKALKARTRTPHTDDDLSLIIQEATIGTDRVFAIVWGTFLEERLKRQLAQNMRHMTDDEVDSFFGDNGAAADFAKKIQIGYGMGMLSKEYKNDLNLIREIRNAFAHVQAPLSFSDKAVSDVCSALVAPKCWKQVHVKRPLPRDLFQLACMFYVSAAQIVPAHYPRNASWWSGEPVPWL